MKHICPHCAGGGINPDDRTRLAICSSCQGLGKVDQEDWKDWIDTERSLMERDLGRFWVEMEMALREFDA